MLTYIGGELSSIYVDPEALERWLEKLKSMSSSEHAIDGLLLTWILEMVCLALKLWGKGTYNT